MGTQYDTDKLNTGQGGTAGGRPYFEEPHYPLPGGGASYGGGHWEIRFINGKFQQVWIPSTGAPGSGGSPFPRSSSPSSPPATGSPGASSPGAAPGAGTYPGTSGGTITGTVSSTGGGIGGAIGNMTWQDWIRAGMGAYGVATAGGGSGAAGIGPVSVPGALGNTAISGLGYGNLLDILMSQGRTSPDLMNRELAGIERNTQAQQLGVQGTLAQRGLSRSGVGQALGAAVGQAGVEQKSQRMAQESALADERKRADLDLFLRLFVQPGIDYQALASGQYNANRQADSEEDAARLAALAKLIDALSKEE